MNELLRPNQTLPSQSGQPCTVLKFLGSGGQGEVYRVRWGAAEFALKWYYPHAATAAQYTALEELVRAGSPSDRFLWPLDLVCAPDVPGFGYLMPLRPAQFRSLTELMVGRVDPTMAAVVTLAIELTKALRSLHNNGLCYRDISFTNAFFVPATGAVLICDNDNVTTNRSPVVMTIMGTPDFMAPEIVRGEAAPSTTTDLHSLAVLLFYILHIGHPLVGQRALGIHCWDMAARELLFGHEPRFIFDPADHSNEAVDRRADPSGECGGTALTYWRLYPQVLRDTFTKAFTAGLRDPDGRVTELEWLNVLVALRDAIFPCACGSPNFYDLATIRATGGTPPPCWACQQAPRLPFRLRLGRAVVMLNADTQLFPHHLAEGRAFDFTTPLAAVVRHPTEPGVWGLKNLGPRQWVATVAGGLLKDVPPSRSVSLASGTKVNFGSTTEGEIRY